MLIYAGIDEAGYGPMFGPLCVASSVFVIDGVDPADGAPDLWRAMRRVVCRRRRDPRRRIAIDDSKKLKGTGPDPGTMLRHLERGVLSAVIGLAGDEPPTDDDDLFHRLGVEVPARPWYGVTPRALPVGHETDELRIAGRRLQRGFDQAGITGGWVRCEAIDPADLNDEARRLGSKASVNFGAVARLLEQVWSDWPDAHPRVIVDRQGGRQRYTETLEASLGVDEIEVVVEQESLSRYRLRRGDHRLTVSFVKEAERQHLPVALASMTAKYTRELLMLRLNAFFQGHRPGLSPTAGYVEDGRRYLREIEPVIVELGLDRRSLVRQV